jgi:uncharacterized protein (TIGR03118 family)
MSRRLLALIASLGLFAVAALPVTARNINGINAYVVHNLVSDGGVPAERTDPNLVNGWGITAGPTTPWWVSNEATDTSTLYGGDGTPRPLVVTVAGGPTGDVFNGSADFKVSVGGGTPAPARFLFATLSGEVRGWNPTVAATEAVVGYDGTEDGAIYTGLATGASAGANYLYAADFHNAEVEVLDGQFEEQEWDGAFVDPNLPAGYAPFGIQNVAGMIVVTYALQDADAEEEVAGPGLGVVDAFGTDGSFLGRIASGGDLNAPWGVALAPSTFGKFSGHLLIGNFGDGRITAYRATAGGWEPRGKLKGTNHRPISIDGLWGIGFGNGAGSGPTNTLYFAAGPDDEEHGLFGSITLN